MRNLVQLGDDRDCCPRAGVTIARLSRYPAQVDLTNLFESVIPAAEPEGIGGKVHKGYQGGEITRPSHATA